MMLDQIVELLKSFFPRRWFVFGGKELKRLLTVVAVGILFAVEVAQKIVEETLTKTSVDSLDEKEREFGISSGENLSIEERRRRITARNWSRGGPTNTKQFQESLSMLSGSKFVRLVPDFNGFSVLYDLYEPGGPVNISLLQDYIKRNKLAHLGHCYRINYADKAVKLEYPTPTATTMTESLLCGSFYPESEV